MTPERQAELRAIYVNAPANGAFVTDQERAAIREYLEDFYALADRMRERRYAEYREQMAKNAARRLELAGARELAGRG